jgi:OOP family OmpA-OmpF porin
MPEPPPPSVPVPTPGPEPLNIAVPPASSVIVLSEAVLHFANNGSILPHQAATAIQEVVDQLKAYGGAYTLMVSGHTSSLGSKSHNYALSRLRAEAVVRLLVNGGIPVERVFAVGRGPDVPIADNRTPEGQSRNRRVEIEVKAGDSSIQKTRTSTALIDADEGVKPKGKDKPRE